MRPLELVINGFRSYAEEARFDFRGRHLIGVVGPIGSGKSSILDAIAFALYGKTPTFSANTGALINQRQAVAQVQLTFRVDQQAWQVVRAIRRVGQGQAMLYPFNEERWELDRGAGVSGQKAVTDRIEQLIGLDFDAFRRSVLLAQNRFAEFLNATPTERDKVLQGVFNLDRITAMQDVAKVRVQEANAESKAIEGRVADALAARARVGERRMERDTHAKRHATLEALRPAIDEHTKAEREARERVTAAQQRIADLDALRAGLPPRDESNSTIDGFDTLATQVAAARQTREQAEVAEAGARTAREQAVKKSGGPERLEAAADALRDQQAAQAMHTDRTTRRDAARVALEAAQTATKAAQAAAKQTTAEAKAAEKALTTAEAAVAAADKALHHAERLDFAITLREGIAAGEACPVCGRKIAKMPPGEASPDLDRAHEARAAAQAALQGADTTARRAREAATHAAATDANTAQQVEATTTALAAAEEALVIATTALTACDAQVLELLGKGDAAKQLTTLRSALAEADAAMQVASKAAQAARDAESAATATYEGGRSALTSLRTRLAMIAATLGLDVPEDESPAAVRALLDGVRERWSAERKTATETERVALEGAEAAAQRRRAALTSSDVAEDASFEDAVGEAKQRVAVLDALIAEDERRILDAADAEAHSAAIEVRRAVYTRLAGDLTPSKFLNYLLEDERTSLAEIGSEWFERLSRGRYRFADDGSFDVVDLTAAEKPRKSATLSGGETFLASLSLALALAEMVTQGGGRLDAFFLDEGFGSLDEEHLDLAMEGIERLVTEADDRLVVIVSHVPALRERIEDLVVLDRDPATGDTIVRRGRTAGHTEGARAEPSILVP